MLYHKFITPILPLTFVVALGFGVSPVCADGLFDLIVPTITTDSTSGTIYRAHSYFGWVVSTKTNLSAEILAGARIFSHLDLPSLRSYDEFNSEYIVAPLCPGQVAGDSISFNSDLFDPLLLPGESLLSPNVPIWSHGIRYPAGYSGTNQYFCCVAISNEYATFTSEFRYAPTTDVWSRILGAQRVSSRSLPGAPVIIGISQQTQHVFVTISNLDVSHSYSIEQSSQPGAKWVWDGPINNTGLVHRYQSAPLTGAVEAVYRARLGP